MSEEQRLQVVDAHVHLWDLTANPAWYPALEGAEEFAGLGDVTKMARDYLPPEYLVDLVDLDLVGLVHVSAVSAPRVHLDEARWVEEALDQIVLPSVTVGALEATHSRAEIEADLDAQASSRLRGARVLHGLEPDSTTAAHICAALGERGMVFDLVAHPATIPGFRDLLVGFPDLSVVLEHAGWPEATDADHLRSWGAALAELAELPNVDCKISGIGMATHSLAVDSQRPWIEGCLDAFGAERCIFGGNFPVDAMYGSYAELIGTVSTVLGQLDEADRRAVLVENARRAYRL